MRIGGIYILKHPAVPERHVCLATLVGMMAASPRVVTEGPLVSSSFLLKLFDHVTENEITLKNTGKVGFQFKVLTDHQSSQDNLMPGVPLTLPPSVSSPPAPAHGGREMMGKEPRLTPTSHTPQTRHSPLNVLCQDYGCDLGGVL